MFEKAKIRVGLRGDPHTLELHVDNKQLPFWDLDYAPSVVGKKVPKVASSDMLTECGRFTQNIGCRALPDLLYAKVLRCPHAHARVESIDPAQAQALPGVKVVITFDRAEALAATPCSTADATPPLSLLGRTSHSRGEAVAAVAAETELIAEDALRLIKVRYSPLPLAGTDQEIPASAPPAQEGDESGLPTGKPQAREQGNVEQAFQEPDLFIYEGAFQVSAALPIPLEPSTCVAAWEGDTLNIWASAQGIFALRDDLARVLNTAASNIRVIAERVGGGFGLRTEAVRCGTITALLAKQAGRPVKLAYERREESLAGADRPPATIHIRIGARRDGALQALDFRACGAAAGASRPIWMTYRCPNIRTEEADEFTSGGLTVPSSVPGLIQGTFALEQAMDELARRLDLDPLELRRRNFADQPYLPLGNMYGIGAEKIGWHEYPRTVGTDPGSVRRGVGMAVGVWPGSGRAFAQAVVRIYPEGSVEVVVGAQDLGTGTGTVLGMIAAEELGVPLEKVKVSLGDTASGLAAPPSGRGLTLQSVGPAVRHAARDARQKLCQEVSPASASRPEHSARRGTPSVESAPLRRQPWTPEAREMLSTPVVGYGESEESPTGRDYPAWAVQFVDASVDTETGFVKVNKVVSLVEAGRVMNRLTLESAIIGGTIMGLGAALCEEQVIDRQTGLALNPGRGHHGILDVLGSPPIEVVIMDAVSPANSLGVKGLADLPMIPTAAAVANAVANALGVRICDMPLTPAKVLAACSDRLQPATLDRTPR